MRSYHFVLLRYQEKLTFQAIANRYGVTKGLVRSAIVKIRARLRHPSRAKLIESLIEREIQESNEAECA